MHESGRTDVHFGLGAAAALHALKNYAKKLRAADYATITGRVPYEKLLEMLSATDVCVNAVVTDEMND